MVRYEFTVSAKYKNDVRKSQSYYVSICLQRLLPKDAVNSAT